MEHYKKQLNQYKQLNVTGRKLLNKVINRYKHKRYVYNKSYTYRGLSGRKGRLFVNRIKYNQYYKTIFHPTYSSSSIAI